MTASENICLKMNNFQKNFKNGRPLATLSKTLSALETHRVGRKKSENVNKTDYETDFKTYSEMDSESKSELHESNKSTKDMTKPKSTKLPDHVALGGLSTALQQELLGIFEVDAMVDSIFDPDRIETKPSETHDIKSKDTTEIEVEFIPTKKLKMTRIKERETSKVISETAMKTEVHKEETNPITDNESNVDIDLQSEKHDTIRIIDDFHDDDVQQSSKDGLENPQDKIKGDAMETEANTGETNTITDNQLNVDTDLQSEKHDAMTIIDDFHDDDVQQSSKDDLENPQDKIEVERNQFITVLQDNKKNLKEKKEIERTKVIEGIRRELQKKVKRREEAMMKAQKQRELLLMLKMEKIKNNVETRLKMKTERGAMKRHKAVERTIAHRMATVTTIKPPIVHVDYEAFDEEQLDEKINEMIHKSNSLYTCTVCGKATSGKSLGKRQNLRDHVEARHVEGVSHYCQVCGAVAKTRNSLRMHMHNYHKVKKGESLEVKKEESNN